jgi:S1-C subfamily serine protease
MSPRGKIDIGDIITTIDGKDVHTANDLLDILDRHEGGDIVTMEYERDGQRQQTTVTLQIWRRHEIPLCLHYL